MPISMSLPEVKYLHVIKGVHATKKSLSYGTTNTKG